MRCVQSEFERVQVGKDLAGLTSGLGKALGWENTVSQRNLIATNANLIQALRDEIESTWQHRDEGAEQRQAWITACQRFSELYNQLAYPGGLEASLAQGSQGDSEAMELAVQFLEEDPWYYRSGYIKERLIQRVKQTSLSPDQRARLCNVILKVVDSRDRREFRRYCGLAVVVRSPELVEALAHRVQVGDSGVRRRAQGVLDRLNKEPK